MSYIAAGTKMENLPTPRDSRGDRKRTAQAKQVRAMKGDCPEGRSLKAFAKATPTGLAWLKRKREA